MQFKNPCKKCIVKTVCKERCYYEQDYWETRLFIITLTIKICIFAAFVTFLYDAIAVKII